MFVESRKRHNARGGTCSVLRLAGLVSVVLFLGISTANAYECGRAGTLYEQSFTADANKETLLHETIGLCPHHAQALNDLAVIKEEQGHLEEAEALYKRAVNVDPDDITPYAGLGDVYIARGAFKEAAEAYGVFLTGLNEEKLKGDPRGLAVHEVEYRSRWEQAVRKSGGSTEIGPLTSARRIVSSLTTRPTLRGITITGRSKPSIDIQVLFAIDSDLVDTTSKGQIEQIAMALKDPALEEVEILIEGHTDSTGDERYNLDLSLRRAEMVKRTLVKQYGIQPHRTKTEGFGETRPIVSNKKEEGRSLNRRVTFINLGSFAGDEPTESSLPDTSQVGTSDHEALFWQAIEYSQEASSFEAYLAQFPNGTFAQLSRLRLKKLKE